ncbi:MAG: hypothetical protein RR553_03950 [Akkermansia sp.]
MKHYILIPFLACASMALAESGAATDKEKKEEVKATLEQAKMFLLPAQ